SKTPGLIYAKIDLLAKPSVLHLFIAQIFFPLPPVLPLPVLSKLVKENPCISELHIHPWLIAVNEFVRKPIKQDWHPLPKFQDARRVFIVCDHIAFHHLLKCRRMLFPQDILKTRKTPTWRDRIHKVHPSLQSSWPGWNVYPDRYWNYIASPRCYRHNASVSF